MLDDNLSLDNWFDQLILDNEMISGELPLKNRIRSVVALLTIICLAVAPDAVRCFAQTETASKASDPVPDYSAFKDSYHIPFAGRVNFKHLLGMHVRASLNGGPATTFQVDTGSTGVIVSADEVPNIDPNAPPGEIKYSSSGVELYGVWTKVTITFPDSKDAQGHVATAVIPVLAVKTEKVTGVGVNAGTQKASDHPHPHMFGIGFGRGAESHMERNPFVCLNEMQAGTMRRGYTISRDGFTLGLTKENAGAGYIYQKLKDKPVSPETAAMKPGLKDWLTAPGSLTVGPVNASAGTILMDTGLTNMMLAAPVGPSGGDVAAGTDVTIHLLDGKVDYSFKVGDAADPLAPRRVTWIKPTHGVYVNTGLRALSAFDYLFDDDGGYLALRPVKTP